MYTCIFNLHQQLFPNRYEEISLQLFLSWSQRGDQLRVRIIHHNLPKSPTIENKALNFGALHGKLISQSPPKVLTMTCVSFPKSIVYLITDLSIK